MANRFPSFIPPTPKQKRQRELSWALRICMGFRGAARHFIPKDIILKQGLLVMVDGIIESIRVELRNIK